MLSFTYIPPYPDPPRLRTPRSPRQVAESEFLGYFADLSREELVRNLQRPAPPRANPFVISHDEPLQRIPDEPHHPPPPTYSLSPLPPLPPSLHVRGPYARRVVGDPPRCRCGGRRPDGAYVFHTIICGVFVFGWVGKGRCGSVWVGVGRWVAVVVIVGGWVWV